jgi:release factor glutamine methyltransferase
MSSRSLTIRDLLTLAAGYLKEKGIESPRLTAEVLLAHQLKVDRVFLYLNFDQPLTPAEVSGFRSLIQRRLRHEPLQYITGVQEFWSLEFTVGPQVLIPRPESELLIELGAELLRSMDSPPPTPRILDLATGSGVLAVSLAKEFPQGEIWATDISADALKIARLNAEKHEVLNRIRFLQGDLWEALAPYPEMAFDLILSNPPYVSDEEYGDLPPEVRDFEPRTALDGGEGGMFYIRKIVEGGSDYLKPCAWLLLEMAPAQTSAALGIIEKSGKYFEYGRVKDYSRRYRVVRARRGDGCVQRTVKAS